jgi:hypothetical protein
MASTPPDEGSRRTGQTADRLAESIARLVLSLTPGGAILAEAVSFARALHDDAEADAARAALDARLGVLAERLAALESAGDVVRISGDRARVLAVAVRYANEHVVGYCDADATIQELGITADSYREAVQELDELYAVTSYGNANHASGYSGVSVNAGVFVDLVGQVVPGVVAGRELGELLAVFPRAKNDEWVPREDFEVLGIPTPRAQHLLQYLEDEGLIELLGPGTAADQLMFLNVRLLPRGRRVLRGDEPLPGA